MVMMKIEFTPEQVILIKKVLRSIGQQKEISFTENERDEAKYLASVIKNPGVQCRTCGHLTEYDRLMSKVKGKKIYWCGACSKLLDADGEYLSPKRR